MKVLYKTGAIAYGAREGRVVSDDDRLDVELAKPVELGGPGGDGTNPEQLFAAGWSSCFLSALQVVAGKQQIAVDGATVHADISLGRTETGLELGAELTVRIPGLAREQVQQLIEAAHQVCPYSRATRGNIGVTLTAGE